MTRQAAVVIALVVLIAAGVVHGLWAERWGPSELLQDAASRVDKVPLAIGDWKGAADEADPAAFAQAGAQSYWARTYVHSRVPATVHVILMCGRAGRMAVHTPEVCYRGAGYEIVAKPEVWPVPPAAGAGSGALWTAQFSKGSGRGADLRLYWGWNADGSWQASSNPRWQFGGEPFLYKLYLTHTASGDFASQSARDFMSQLVPELRKTLLARTP